MVHIYFYKVMNNQHYIDAPFVLATRIHWVSTTFANSKAKNNINTHGQTIFLIKFHFYHGVRWQKLSYDKITTILPAKSDILVTANINFFFSTITFSFTAKHEEGKTFHQLKLKKKARPGKFYSLVKTVCTRTIF